MCVREAGGFTGLFSNKLSTSCYCPSLVLSRPPQKKSSQLICQLLLLSQLSQPTPPALQQTIQQYTLLLQQYTSSTRRERGTYLWFMMPSTCFTRSALMMLKFLHEHIRVQQQCHRPVEGPQDTAACSTWRTCEALLFFYCCKTLTVCCKTLVSLSHLLSYSYERVLSETFRLSYKKSCRSYS